MGKGVKKSKKAQRKKYSRTAYLYKMVSHSRACLENSLFHIQIKIYHLNKTRVRKQHYFHI